MLANSRRALEAAAWCESLLLKRVDLGNDLRRRLLFPIATHELQSAAKQQGYQSHCSLNLAAGPTISRSASPDRCLRLENLHCSIGGALRSMRLLSNEVTKIRDEHHGNHGSMCIYLYANIWLWQCKHQPAELLASAAIVAGSVPNFRTRRGCRNQ